MDDIIFVQNQWYKLIEPEQWKLSKHEKITYFFKEMDVNWTNARYNLKVFFDWKYFTSVEIHLLNMPKSSKDYTNKIYNFIKFFDVYVDKEVLLLPEKIFYDFSKLNQKYPATEIITIQWWWVYNKLDFSKKFSIEWEYNIWILRYLMFVRFNLDTRNGSNWLDFDFFCLIRWEDTYTITDRGIQKCRLYINDKDVLFDENKDNLPLVKVNDKDSKNIYIWNILYQTKKILERFIVNKSNLESALLSVYFEFYSNFDVSWNIIKTYLKFEDYHLENPWEERQNVIKELEELWWAYEKNLRIFVLKYSNHLKSFIKNISEYGVVTQFVSIATNLFIKIWEYWKLYSLNKISELILVDDNYTWYNSSTIFQELKLKTKNPLLLKNGKLVGLFKDWTFKVFNKDWSLSKKFDLNNLLNWTKNKSQVTILDCSLLENYVYIYWRWTEKFIKIDINKDKVEYFDFWELKYTCLWEEKSNNLSISKMKNNEYLSLFWLDKGQESCITQTSSYYDRFSDKDSSVYQFSDYNWIDTIDYCKFKQYLIFLKESETDFDYYDADNFPYYDLQYNCFSCYWLKWIKKMFSKDKIEISWSIYIIREGKLYFLETMLRRYNIYSSLFSFRKYDLESQNRDQDEDFLNLWKKWWKKRLWLKKSNNIAVFWRINTLTNNNFYVGLDNWKVWVIFPKILS